MSLRSFLRRQASSPISLMTATGSESDSELQCWNSAQLGSMELLPEAEEDLDKVAGFSDDS